MDFFLAQNMTNPILTYSKKGGSIDFRGHLIYQTSCSCTKNIWPRGLFNYFLPGSTEWKCPFNWKKKGKKKKWRMTGVRRGWDLWQELSPFLSLPRSLCYLSFLQAWLTAWIVLWLLNRWFTAWGVRMYHVLRYLSTELSKKTFFFGQKTISQLLTVTKITSEMFPDNNPSFYPVSKVYPSLHFYNFKVITEYLRVPLQLKVNADHFFPTV